MADKAFVNLLGETITVLNIIILLMLVHSCVLTMCVSVCECV